MKRIILYSSIALFFILMIALILIVGEPRSSANFILRITGPVDVEFDGQCSTEVNSGEPDTTTTGITTTGKISGGGDPKLYRLPSGAVHIYCSVSRLTPGEAINVTLLDGGEPLVEEQSTSPADPALVEYAAGSPLKRVWERLVYWVTKGWREKPPSTPRRPGS